MKWQAVIFGPEQTAWEGGTFKLEVVFSEDYPNKAPHVKFTSRMFHPNVYADGQICLDILQNQWSPIYDISAILTSIQSLLSDPNPNSPANQEAAQLFVENRREYNRRVQLSVEESWSDAEDEDEDEDEEEEEEEGEGGSAAASQKKEGENAEKASKDLKTDTGGDVVMDASSSSSSSSSSTGGGQALPPAAPPDPAAIQS